MKITEVCELLDLRPDEKVIYYGDCYHVGKIEFIEDSEYKKEGTYTVSIELWCLDDPTYEVVYIDEHTHEIDWGGFKFEKGW